MIAYCLKNIQTSILKFQVIMLQLPDPDIPVADRMAMILQLYRSIAILLIFGKADVFGVPFDLEMILYQYTIWKNG